MTKKKFMLRLDEDVYNAIEKWADDEFRSVNGQMEWILANALKQHKRKLKTEEEIPESPAEGEL